MHNISHHCFLAIVLAVLACTGPASATTWMVDTSGGGDHREISDAVAAAAAGDTILVAPGDYDGDILLFGDAAAGLSIIGTSAIDRAVVGGDTLGFGLWDITEAVRFENLEVRGVSGPDTRGAFRFQSSRAELVNCVIKDNVGPGDCSRVGGGATLYFGSDVLFQGCLFEGNTGWDAAGGILVWDSRADVRGCVFRANQACYGGALEFYHCHEGYSSGFEPSVVEHTLFVGNAASELGGALMTVDSSPIVRSNTFVDNSSPSGSTILMMQGAPAVDDNIFVGSPRPISCDGFEGIPNGNPQLGRNLVWNAEADPVQICATDGELIIADPLFCDAGSGDYRLCAESIALQGEDPLGAYGEGCSECPTVNAERGSMGAIKGRFRGGSH